MLVWNTSWRLVLGKGGKQASNVGRKISVLVFLQRVVRQGIVRKRHEAPTLRGIPSPVRVYLLRLGISVQSSLAVTCLITTFMFLFLRENFPSCTSTIPPRSNAPIRFSSAV